MNSSKINTWVDASLSATKEHVFISSKDLYQNFCFYSEYSYNEAEMKSFGIFLSRILSDKKWKVYKGSFRKIRGYFHLVLSGAPEKSVLVAEASKERKTQGEENTITNQLKERVVIKEDLLEKIFVKLNSVESTNKLVLQKISKLDYFPKEDEVLPTLVEKSGKPALIWSSTQLDKQLESWILASLQVDDASVIKTMFLLENLGTYYNLGPAYMKTLNKGGRLTNRIFVLLNNIFLNSTLELLDDKKKKEGSRAIKGIKFK